MAALTPPSLFATRRDSVIVCCVVAMVAVLHLTWHYVEYRRWIARPFTVTQAYVEDAYFKRKGRYRYQVLRLRTQEGLRLFTTVKNRTLLTNRQLKIRLIPDASLQFWDYMGRFYVKSRIVRLLPEHNTLRQTLLDRIARQHRDSNATALYQALFLAQPLPKPMRQSVARWGVSHLVALSGFHIGLIALVLYTLLRFPYRFWQARFAPYRHEALDLGIVVVAIAGAYVWLTGAPEALVRAYTMMIVGVAALVLGVTVVDFALLGLIVGVLVALQPRFAFSIGFWFSVAGVGYIFLLLRYLGHLSKLWLALAVIPVGVFVLMLPLTHAFFDVAALQQFISPILSVLFTLFYPLSAFVHFIGHGNLFDALLSTLWQMPVDTISIRTPPLFLAFYLVLSMLSVRYQAAFYALTVIAVGFAVYMAGLFALDTIEVYPFVKQMTKP